jgi:hypothetical protein
MNYLSSFRSVFVGLWDGKIPQDMEGSRQIYTMVIPEYSDNSFGTAKLVTIIYDSRSYK